MKHILTIAILLAACACAPKWEVLDADGNIWDFGFGLSWSGVISDARTERYCR